MEMGYILHPQKVYKLDMPYKFMDENVDEKKPKYYNEKYREYILKYYRTHKQKWNELQQKLRYRKLDSEKLKELKGKYERLLKMINEELARRALNTE